MPTAHKIKAFKQAVEQIVVTGKMPGTYGICYALDSIDYTSASYTIMAALLTHLEYNEGLGENGDFNIDRQNFIILLHVMSEEDIAEIVESHYASREFPQ